MRYRRLGLVLGAITIAWILSGCVAPVPAPKPGTVENGCPNTQYSHQHDPDDVYVKVPEPPITGETIGDVILPGGKPVGCENPKYRLVRGGDEEAKALFDRLTKDVPRGTLPTRPRTVGTFTVYNFMSQVKVRPDGIAVGYREHRECRGALVWIFQWPDEAKHKIKPVELEFVDDSASEPCTSGTHQPKDADGGGP